MIKQRFLAGCLALATALSLPAATGQSPTPIPRSPPPPPAAAPPVITPTPSLTPELPSRVVAPALVIAREASRGRDSKTYDFESDTVEGDLARPDAAASAVAPPEVPAYSDLCKASPKPPWCSDAPKGSGN